ncbi:MAG TPA: hypothetical protein VHU82_04320 [Vicinamibacterales bacterium]|nr:hypothetical protein [Vicinamibacterales bacterium]
MRGFDTLRVLRQIERAPFRSPDEVQASQFQQLTALLAHAQAHVPYYRELFGTLSLHAGDIRTWDDFSHIPVLTKDVIRERQEDLVRDDVPRDALTPHFSGGSTGVPLKFYRSRDYMVASDAGHYRNLTQCGWRPGEMIAFFWGGNDKLDAMARWEFELRQLGRRMYQFDPFHAGDQEMAGWARRFRRVRPRVVHGYASTIARFASFLEGVGESIGGVKGVFTTAEKLYRPQRLQIERVFRCRVFDCYGSSEVQNVAAECPDGRMHINADFVVLEEDTGAVEGPRPFLLTSLRNWSMPFIRYRNEDCGHLSNDTCDCGNHFPLMRLEIARTSDNFLFPGGRVVHGEFFTHLMYGCDGVVNFQFHQTATDEMVLWVVAGGGDPEARQARIRDAVRRIQCICPESPVRVDVREVDAIPLSSAGKHRFTRSDVSLSSPTAHTATAAVPVA